MSCLGSEKTFPHPAPLALLLLSVRSCLSSSTARRPLTARLAFLVRAKGPWQMVLGVPAQPSARGGGGASSLPGVTGGDDAGRSPSQKKASKKKKRDRSRLTDLDAFDLEGEEPGTASARLTKHASKKVGDVGIVSARVRKAVFGELEDLSDDELTPRGEGGGARIQGALAHAHAPQRAQAVLVARRGSVESSARVSQQTSGAPGGFGASANFGGRPDILQGAGVRKSFGAAAQLGGVQRSLMGSGGLSGGLPGGGFGGGGGYGGGGVDPTEGSVMGSLFAPMRRSGMRSGAVASSQPVPVYQPLPQQQRQRQECKQHQDKQERGREGVEEERQEERGREQQSSEPDWMGGTASRPTLSNPERALQPLTPEPTLPARGDRGGGRREPTAAHGMDMEADASMPSPIPMQPAVAESPAMCAARPAFKKEDSYEDFTWKDDEDEGNKEEKAKEGAAPVATAPLLFRQDESSCEDLTRRDDKREDKDGDDASPSRASAAHNLRSHHHGDRGKIHGRSRGRAVGGKSAAREAEVANILPAAGVHSTNMSTLMFDAGEIAAIADDDTPAASPATIAMVHAVPDAMAESMDLDEDMEAAAAAAAAMETAPTSWVVGHRGFVVRSVEEDLYKMTCTREPSAQGHEEEAVGPASVMFDAYAGFKEPVADPQAPRIKRDQSLGPAAATATEEKEEEMKEEALDPDPGPEDDDPWSGFQKNYGLAGARQSGVLGDIDGDPLDDSFTLFQKKKEEREGEKSGVGMRAKRGPQQETLELNDSADPNRSVLAGVADSHDEVLGPAMPPAPAGDRDAHKARFAGAGWASTGADDDLGFEAGGRVDYDDGDGGGSTGTDDDDDVFGNAVPTARRGGGDDDLFDAEISELDLSDS